ncbi:hypothetical protein Tco_0969335, partial [Tanacetum coccineum]
MAFGGNTRDLGLFGEETDEITDLHQFHEEILFLEHGYGVAGIKRCRRDPSGKFDVFFRDQLLVFQQHQDESLYDSWTHFKDVIRKVRNHGLSIWTPIEFFLKHLDLLSHHIINLTAKGDLRKFSDIGAWYAIEDCAQYDKKCSNPTSAISDETIANLNAQIVGDDMVRVQVPRCMVWLDYDEHVDSLSTIDNEEKLSLDVDISNWEMFNDDWGLESKEVSPLGEELSLLDRQNKVEIFGTIGIHGSINFMEEWGRK